MPGELIQMVVGYWGKFFTNFNRIEWVLAEVHASGVALISLAKIVSAPHIAAIL